MGVEAQLKGHTCDGSIAQVRAAHGSKEVNTRDDGQDKKVELPLDTAVEGRVTELAIPGGSVDATLDLGLFGARLVGDGLFDLGHFVLVRGGHANVVRW